MQSASRTSYIKLTKMIEYIPKAAPLNRHRNEALSHLPSAAPNTETKVKTAPVRPANPGFGAGCLPELIITFVSIWYGLRVSARPATSVLLTDLPESVPSHNPAEAKLRRCLVCD